MTDGMHDDMPDGFDDTYSFFINDVLVSDKLRIIKVKSHGVFKIHSSNLYK